MKAKSFMIIAGEPSGDANAASLVAELRRKIAETDAATSDLQPLRTGLEPRFFGAGGSQMAAAGVALDVDMTRHSVIGLSDALRKYFQFRRIFFQLFRVARERQPDAIICLDFSGFNRRFAHAVKGYVRQRSDWFHNWQPRIVQYISPQVWASRAGRAYQMARDYDLLLTIFPFEQAWYQERVPSLRVEFVGHPMLERYAHYFPQTPRDRDTVLVLPGSRPGELSRHLPVMSEAILKIQAACPELRFRMVVPDMELLNQISRDRLPSFLEIQAGGLPEALSSSRLAIASTGTVTMECALFGVPTVAIYKTSWSTYQIARRIVKVNYLAMPNILAGESILPEFIQDSATSENIARAAIQLLKDEDLRKSVQAALARVVANLGGPGGSRRAAEAVLALLGNQI